MDDVAGSLEAGKAADCVIIDLNQASVRPDFDRRRTIASLVWAGDSRLVDTVFVAGQKLLENGRSTRWNEEEVIVEAERALRDIERETDLKALLPQRAGGQSLRAWSYI
jgi:5-methylthioadenosine/S-adenosylhomocysteine deaminase